MNIRYASAAAILSIVALLAWLSATERRHSTPDSPLVRATADAPGLQEREVGSALPCLVPLAWRIARVDPEFGMSMDDARAALEEAVADWERALDRQLFSIDSLGSTGPGAGFPIRLVHDQRQERTEERRRIEEELRVADRGIEARRRELDGLRGRHASAWARYQDRVRDLDRRVSAHNDVARRWNQRGDTPEEVRARNLASGEALERERRELQDEQRRLEASRGRLLDEEERLDQGIAARNAMADALAKAFPSMRVEAGLYREAVLAENGTVVSVRREIRIHRFEDREDLVRVLTHELGHALGLGHAPAPGAMMSEEYGLEGTPPGRGVQAADVALLRSLCPDL